MDACQITLASVQELRLYCRHCFKAGVPGGWRMAMEEWRVVRDLGVERPQMHQSGDRVGSQWQGAHSAPQKFRSIAAFV